MADKYHMMVNEVELHCHTCEHCNVTWQHPTPDDDVSDEVREAAHQCPKCGNEERWKARITKNLVIDYPWTGTYTSFKTVVSKAIKHCHDWWDDFCT